MKVILNADVPNLGEEGDVRDVKRGFARNFLLPRSMAMPYNKQSMALVESRRAQIEKRKEEKRAQAQGMKQRLEAEVLNLTMPAGENGRLFGAVTSTTIADEMAKRGITVERKRIEIAEHTIKASGNYRVRIRLYGNEEAMVRVLVNQQSKPEDAQAAGDEPAAKAEGAPAPEAAVEKTAKKSTRRHAEPETEEPVKESAENGEETED
ncbi:MAG TPA: 50S ribosomal protein L9 [Spirochaetia bacterium]|nr:50S ribosomal protein L9 [Spirochaetia bacterium]